MAVDTTGDGSTVTRFRLSCETIDALRTDLKRAGYGEEQYSGTGLEQTLVLVPQPDNRILLGVDESVEEVDLEDLPPLKPRSLFSAAIFVGEGSGCVMLSLDGVPMYMCVRG